VLANALLSWSLPRTQHPLRRRRKSRVPTPTLQRGCQQGHKIAQASPGAKWMMNVPELRMLKF
jgi:hypothetical protein